MPSEVEEEVTVHRLNRKNSRGNTKLRTEHLQGRLREAHPIKESIPTNPERWEKPEKLAQHMWESSMLPI